MKKREYAAPFDPSSQSVVMRISICTGEKTLFFRDNDTGRTSQIDCIHDDRELAEFLRRYKLRAEDIKREW